MGNQGVTIIDGVEVKIFFDNFPRLELPVTVVSGAGVLAAGTVLGKITASGKYGAYDDGNVDGTEVADAILCEEVDATSADVVTTAYFAGHFNEDALAGIDAAAKIDFRTRGVFVSKVA